MNGSKLFGYVLLLIAGLYVFSSTFVGVDDLTLATLLGVFVLLMGKEK